eukprot:m.136621 g.136621  ORF g.136621 m.136621 type:complete len:277 (+) comp17575_c0_seq2:281-1111(+)
MSTPVAPTEHIAVMLHNVCHNYYPLSTAATLFAIALVFCLEGIKSEDWIKGVDLHAVRKEVRIGLLRYCWMLESESSVCKNAVMGDPKSTATSWQVAAYLLTGAATALYMAVVFVAATILFVSSTDKRFYRRLKFWVWGHWLLHLAMACAIAATAFLILAAFLTGAGFPELSAMCSGSDDYVNSHGHLNMGQCGLRCERPTDSMQAFHLCHPYSASTALLLCCVANPVLTIAGVAMLVQWKTKTATAAASRSRIQAQPTPGVRQRSGAVVVISTDV